RIAEKRAALMKDVARRKIPVTGVSEFPLLEEIAAPIADVTRPPRGDGVDPIGLETLLPNFEDTRGADTIAEPLTWISIAEPFETLRDRSEDHMSKTGARPSVFLATVGPLAEHTARADFARNFFAAGGIESKTAPVPPKSHAELAAAFRASGCKIAVLCGADKRYAEEATEAASALKTAGAVALWLAGKHEADGIDRHIFMGCDVVHELTVALAELGVS
ncbi:MAG: methylmalonyl-CoA mutase, partial [Henriciella sp.]|nr:methylmalonyl-CoA mutase [Henriciella sp.]